MGGPACGVQAFKEEACTWSTVERYIFPGSLASLLVYKQTCQQKRAFMSCLVSWVTFPGWYGEILSRNLVLFTRKWMEQTLGSSKASPIRHWLCHVDGISAPQLSHLCLWDGSLMSFPGAWRWPGRGAGKSSAWEKGVFFPFLHTILQASGLRCLLQRMRRLG